MGGSFKKTLSKSPIQTIGMRLIQGDNIWRAVTQNAGTPAQRGLHQWINKQYKSATSGGGGGGSDSGGSQYDPAMMMYFSQMQSQQAAQAEAARKAQEDALTEAQKQSASMTAQQAETSAQQQISQEEATRKAKELEDQRTQQTGYSAAANAAIGAGYDVNRARQEQLANLASGINLPAYGYESANAGAGGTGRAANVFNLPKTTGITFGGK